MNDSASDTWHATNQRYLATALIALRDTLQQHIACVQGTSHQSASEPKRHSTSSQVADPGSQPPMLERICAMFGLSSFERDLLLLCASVELDYRFLSLCAAAQGDPQRSYPTFSLALAALPNAHWSALAPNGPLRRWRLIEVGAGSMLTLSPLKINERVLHYLTGVQHTDERLTGIVDPVRIAADMVPSQQAQVEQIVLAWSQSARGVELPIIQLCGYDLAAKCAIGVAACKALGLSLQMLAASSLPTAPGEIESLIRLWEREAALSSSALLIDCDDLDSSEIARVNAVTRMIERTNGAIIVTSHERWRIRERAMVTFEIVRPSPGEQRIIWQEVLGEAASSLNGQIDRLVGQFSLSAHAIRSAGIEVRGRSSQTQDADLGSTLWDVCRTQARPRLDDLAQRIQGAAAWDDLVLPDVQRQILRDIAAHVRQRAKVYDIWGFAEKGTRGLGISVLFAGTSGTGKTLAAEVLAQELRLDLYRIDLSAVVSKYIGETEKNLRRIFDAAESAGAILLFDEADALFGKRSEVKDSHDRYANIEVSYLLQRMEAYRGLAILTTNLKNALDTAFLRRIRFIVQFPFPDAAQRAEIWRRIFPRATPTEGLDVEQLGRLNVAGGNIRNIALNAAFLAADEDAPVQMSHLLRATRSEYAKLEKSLTDAEVVGWVTR